MYIVGAFLLSFLIGLAYGILLPFVPAVILSVITGGILGAIGAHLQFTA